MVRTGTVASAPGFGRSSSCHWHQSQSRLERAPARPWPRGSRGVPLVARTTPARQSTAARRVAVCRRGRRPSGDRRMHVRAPRVDPRGSRGRALPNLGRARECRAKPRQEGSCPGCLASCPSLPRHWVTVTTIRPGGRFLPARQRRPDLRLPEPASDRREIEWSASTRHDEAGQQAQRGLGKSST